MGFQKENVIEKPKPKQAHEMTTAELRPDAIEVTQQIEKFRENGKITVMSEYKWLESRKAGTLIDGQLHVNPFNFPIIDEKLTRYHEYRRRVETAKKIDTKELDKVAETMNNRSESAEFNDFQ